MATILQFPTRPHTAFTEQYLAAHLAFVMTDPVAGIRLYERITSDPHESGFVCDFLESRGLPKLPREPKAAAAFYARLRARVEAVGGN